MSIFELTRDALPTQEKRKFTRREVVLNRPPGGSQPLGMGLRGGAETGLTGIFVSAVSGGGTAAEAGIRPVLPPCRPTGSARGLIRAPLTAGGPPGGHQRQRAWS